MCKARSGARIAAGPLVEESQADRQEKDRDRGRPDRRVQARRRSGRRPTLAANKGPWLAGFDRGSSRGRVLDRPREPAARSGRPGPRKGWSWPARRRPGWTRESAIPIASTMRSAGIGSDGAASDRQRSSSSVPILAASSGPEGQPGEPAEENPPEDQFFRRRGQNHAGQDQDGRPCFGDRGPGLDRIFERVGLSVSRSTRGCRSAITPKTIGASNG